MRPVRLELEGFGTFRDRTVVAFDDLDLVAVVGPTGSGKSTLIDAITFALYGSVARYDNTSLVAPVIHQLSNEAKVRFDFELAGRRYRAVRVVRRQRPTASGAPRASTREARLELDEGEAGTMVLAGTVTELDDQVQALIGLDFRQFTRTIVLPQGAFAEFLTDDPGNRQKLLRRLLDVDIYARMGARARERAAEAAQRLEVLRHELGRLAHASDEAVGTALAEAAALAEFAATATQRLETLSTIDAELDRHRSRVVELDRLLGNLGEVEVPDEARRIGSESTEASARVGEAEAALAEARDRRDGADDAVLAAGDPGHLNDQRRSRQRLDELRAGMAALDAELAAAVEGHTAAAAGATAAEAAADRADARLRELRLAADAGQWAAGLEVGADCPVCGQEVVSLPDRVADAEVAAAEELAGAARAEGRAAAAAAARAEGRLRSLEADHGQQEKAVDALSQQLADAPDLDTLVAAEEAAADAVRRAREAAGAVRDGEQVLAQASRALDRARGAEGRMRSRFTAQRDRVTDLGPPGPAGESLITDWEALAAWSGGKRETLAAEREVAARRGRTLAAEKAELLEVLTTEADRHGIGAPAAELASAVAASRATADARIERLAEQRAHRRELDGRITTLAEQQAVDEALGRQHLSANGFERWLLAEALDDIVARATARLRELSSGRYSLEVVDGSFAVRDHGNADERRDVRTLSGGEIFLASLSLALALADSIAELAPVDSPRLESIFLDEGFGTLDAETLDVLATAIEELSASGRLVIVVTHVRDLADRMPVRFEVRKGPGTSDVERADR
jgi:exonuclease SbcC